MRPPWAIFGIGRRREGQSGMPKHPAVCVEEERDVAALEGVPGLAGVTPRVGPHLGRPEE